MGTPTQHEIIGRYAIYSKIAQGGMASVHLGRLQGAVGFSRTVAIKRLHPHLAEEPEFLATMIDEARLAARIHHPNVVPTLDVVAEGGELLIVMEYVRGESMARLMRAEFARNRSVPLSVASAILIGALHGLHAAHEATSDRGTPLGIVHRDISPQNILVGVDGIPRIIDFGVAKAAGRLQTTGEGVVKGKVAYMAPEQLAALDVTRRVDVYSMGVVLWEMLAGRSLFRADGEAAIVLKVLEGVIEPPSVYAPNLSPELDAVVMKALSRDAGQRFASAYDMAEVLVRVIPPALPTDVGVWVQDLAMQALSNRAGLLAEIESASDQTPIPPPSRASLGSPSQPPPRASAAAIPDDLATVASQPSSVSVEAPRRSVDPGPSSPARPIAAMAAAVALILATGVLAIVWRGGEESGLRPVSPGAPRYSESPVPTIEPPTSPPLVTSWPSATEILVVPMDVMPSASVRGATPPFRPGAKPRAPQAAPSHSSGMVRFAQPD